MSLYSFVKHYYIVCSKPTCCKLQCHGLLSYAGLSGICCHAAAGPEAVSSGIPAAEADLSKELYKVPSHAAWFGYNAIHDIERKSVPDFFCGKAQSKTPKVNMLLLHTDA